MEAFVTEKPAGYYATQFQGQCQPSKCDIFIITIRQHVLVNKRALSLDTALTLVNGEVVQLILSHHIRTGLQTVKMNSQN